MTDLDSPERVLEIGCGTGYGAKLIRRFFNARHITGIDLDPKMIEMAEKSSRDLPSTFQVEGAEKLSFGDNTFDAVFDFGVIHHIPDWRKCISELYRVLKPGGTLILEDLSIESFTGLIGGVIRHLTYHPYSTMYSQPFFETKLTETGFVIAKKKTCQNLGLLRYFAIVAQKT